MKRRPINAPDWLTARPIAHRSLHSKQFGLIENTPAAAAAAIAKNYAIECDIQCTKDGEAVVFHDFTLDRLMRTEGRVDAFTAHELGRLAYKESDQRIVSLADFLARVGGRTPVIISIKSRCNGDMRVADRALATVDAYSGPVCLKSFDPAVLVHLRGTGAACPVGLVAQAHYAEEEWTNLSQERRAAFVDRRDFPLARPDFLSWNLGDLPHAVPMLCRAGVGMPVMTWTVRSQEDVMRGRAWADQIVFEGFEP
ncbi:MAG TPA: glycerophosphodiester phosphodiesterase family protein [Methylocella sp.]|nr:glycerophosphodiester phosphodiesterase family protein [Methylocella sp.]